ncbi:MAG: NAD(P)/FAD-dependent oxidoreductase [Mycoplasma sp.]
MNNIKEFDVAIIGGGPGGLTAAIYAQRANLKTCFIEKGAPGGKMVITAKIENYPGFKSIEGPTLSLEMFNQATELGSEYIGAEAVQIKNIENNMKEVLLNNGNSIIAKVVIIAIGTENRKLDIPGEEKFVGRGVSYCAICDGSFYKNKVVSVIGSGNSACEEAIYLSQIASKVYLIVRGPALKADATVIDEINEKENIELMLNTDTVEIFGTKSVESLEVKDKTKNENIKLDVSAVFPFVGLSAFSIGSEQKVEKTAMNFIVTDKNMQTSIDGIFSVGDINDKKYRQISTAISDGTIAALAAKEYINKNFKKK